MIHTLDHFPGRTITAEGKTSLYFGGTSYLGLQTLTEFQEVFIKNIQKYGTNYGASRKANVQISIFKKAENHLANIVGSEACLTLSSGYLAGQLVAESFYRNNDYHLFYAPDSHAAMRVSSEKNCTSFVHLNALIRAHLETHKSTPVVFLDTIDTEGLNYPDFEALKKLPLDKICLVADDSHGIGIVGTEGSGAYQKLKALSAKELIVCCSLGKGFGIQAGAIFGSKHHISQFSQTDLFGGASPAVPAALATLVDAKTIFTKQRQLLQQNTSQLLHLISNLEQFQYLKDYPVFYFSNDKLAQHLEKNNIVITHFRYPNETSPLLNRIVLSAAHTKKDISILAHILNIFQDK